MGGGKVEKWALDLGSLYESPGKVFDSKILSQQHLQRDHNEMKI